MHMTPDVDVHARYAIGPRRSAVKIRPLDPGSNIDALARLPGRVTRRAGSAPEKSGLMCASGSGHQAGFSTAERPLDRDQVSDHLDGLDGPLVRIGPASDLVEVVANAGDLPGALALDLGRRPGPGGV